MIRKDSLLFEIEKLAQVLAKIIGLKKEGKVKESHDLVNNALVDYFALNEDRLDSISTDEMSALLKEKNFPTEKLNYLANLVFERAHPFEDTPEHINRLHVVLLLFNILERDHRTQSLDNLAKREMIDHFLNNQQYE
ncbi:hypothetical protein [Hufsiella ginkgonis]|uniref:Uncharacterized protein n=1 Tax=Hufsiella ginkgonis TaxID=2695274 RepID=A0A7K1XRR9_9SPHI|nr:hypothetical protein [Hufsiella ginkgonis]MXV13681.1 hypothetical protein [Hufsiella ginkgonis]